jgi:hypothetical protein
MEQNTKISTQQRNAEKKERVLRAWRIERLAHVSRRFDALVGFKKLAKIEALAADDRGNANVRAVAADKAKTVRRETHTQKQAARPFQPSASVGGLPNTLAEWKTLEQKVSEERKAKRRKRRSIDQ